jgi:hypothetical protein
MAGLNSPTFRTAIGACAVAPRLCHTLGRSQPQASKQLRERRVGGLRALFQDLGRSGVVARQDLQSATGIRQGGLLCHLQALMLEVSKLFKLGHLRFVRLGSAFSNSLRQRPSESLARLLRGPDASRRSVSACMI